MNAENATDQAGWSEEISHLFIDYGRYLVPERDYQMRINVIKLALQLWSNWL